MVRGAGFRVSFFLFFFFFLKRISTLTLYKTVYALKFLQTTMPRMGSILMTLSTRKKGPGGQLQLSLAQ